MSTVHNVNLPSTFVASLQPATNYSAAGIFYVGTVGGLGTCNGLLQIPTLPACTTLTSAVLNLNVYSKSGAGPSLVEVHKVTAPSPLDTTTVTYGTPVTIDPNIEATASVTGAGPISITITSLISSWYTTLFPGIALTCNDGSLVLFDSSVSTNPPQLVLTCDGGPGTDVRIVGHYVDDGTEILTATNASDVESALKDISESTRYNFLITNTSAVSASVGLKVSNDGNNYYLMAQGPLAAGATGTYSTSFYTKYVRVYFHSNDPLIPVTLKIDFIAQT